MALLFVTSTLSQATGYSPYAICEVCTGSVVHSARTVSITTSVDLLMKMPLPTASSTPNLVSVMPFDVGDLDAVAWPRP